MTDYVYYRLEDGIAFLTMDDGKANAMSVSMSEALTENLDRALEEADVAVITGRPGLLCAGFDLKVINGTAEQRDAMVNAGARLMHKAYTHPQPVVIACTGHAIAAGALLALTADYRLGILGDYKIGLNETSIGLRLPVFGRELARDRLDNRRLTQATLNATLYDPEAAADIGFLDEVVSEEALLARTSKIAQDLQKLDAKAFAQVKADIRRDTGEKIFRSLK
ncbi:MAG: crotonase/enoyl-CoA hydratase family protein [Porticoccaceae bacterium]|nr:crotonase/enoyl-CoA hydratase family protein [Porticoccaceae bacterium]